MTFDELVNAIAVDKGIPVSQARSEVLESYAKVHGLQNGRANVTAAATAATYRTFSTVIDVGWTYKPSLRFYCETSEWNSIIGILSLIDTTLVRAHNGV
ncbi:hypothetical protein [Paenibacillus sp. CECT 9249]|uniref:hypothetical protein n=1 Tax=Paenibacillus sp. CECT 9249 TaxID=2845385 RepID=UPI001E4590D5|nr:hypothetical protein [Paenibacillus sp. CECT 9249]